MMILLGEIETMAVREAVTRALASLGSSSSSFSFDARVEDVGY